MSRRSRLAAVLAAFLIGLSILGGLHCGHDKAKKEAGGLIGGGNVPAGWDGTADWRSSAMEVIDE